MTLLGAPRSYHFLVLARPKQWIKNLFILVPAIFGIHTLNVRLFSILSATLVAFCLFSSGVYAVNDILDRERDRLHPKKRLRPIARGDVSIPAAAVFCVLTLTAAAGLALLVNKTVALLGGLYVCVNLFYSCRVKHIPIIDIFCIASGFILRVYAGGVAVNVPISPWLMLNMFFLSLFLGFSKRRSELIHATAAPQEHRSVLGEYNLEILNFFLFASCTMSLLCYSLYAIDPGTVRSIGSVGLVYTVPVASYGFFRYIFILFRQNEDIDIAEALLSDKAMLLTFLAGVSLVFFIIIQSRLSIA
jgi:4-hydroxybenzoate polyprenyltransferase